VKNLKILAEETDMRLLIDADMFIYKSAVVSEEETHWGDDIWTLHTDLKNAKRVFTSMVETVKTALDLDRVVMCISDKKNFRKSVRNDYKSNRKGSRKPLGYGALLEWVRETNESITVPFLEADDVMGILATAPNSRSIIVSDDKDMRTIPSKLYRPTNQELIDVTPAMALSSFYTQVLVGDPVDGYKGVPKCGPVTAAKILGNRPDWSQIKAAYEKAGMCEEEAIVQAQLARILHYDDYLLDTNEIKLWRP